MLLSLGGLLLLTPFWPVLAATVGGFDDGGNTLVSAMMMFLGNEDSIYILDKAEMNAATINGHPAWGSLWDIKTRKAAVMDIRTNSFCASGMHLPNGSYVTFGGNDAVTTGGSAGSQKNSDNSTGAWDSLYQDFDGRRSIRILNPCKISDSLNSGNCMWFDEPDQLSMKKQRWYSAAEATGEGRIVIIGGMVTGGYVNRWLPNSDPATENGWAEPTFEYYPSGDGDPQVLNFLVKTSGLNAYVHTFLMASGKMLLQANLSTVLWDHVKNNETPLPDMPNSVIRVYPASGATSMLPLTPANNWTQTLLFCGGSTIPDEGWGDYSGPKVETWNIGASKDCQRLTPEPLDGSQPQYEQDDDMLEPRTMGQFIILPTGQLLLINGGRNGTAGYTTAGTPFNHSLAAEPVYTPAIYDPHAPKGSRWSNQSLSPSKIPRLYHSTAMLLPDASVLVAGSNPNPDVNLTVIFSTEYRADIFYPPYFSAKIRPSPQNLPSTLSYGGRYFDILVPSGSYSGNANDAADATNVTLVRGGFTTHAMNMGQRFMQLNNTYTVNQNGSITLHVSQLPPNPNLFQPGPALLFVNINGVPSTGKLVIVGSGAIGTQPTADVSDLPANLRFNGTITSEGSTGSTSSQSKSNKIILIAGIAGALAITALIAAFAVTRYITRRKSNSMSEKPTFPLRNSKSGGFDSVRIPYAPGFQDSGSGLLHNKSVYFDARETSTPSFRASYWDDGSSSVMQGGTEIGHSSERYPVANGPPSTNILVGYEDGDSSPYGRVSPAMQSSDDDLHQSSRLHSQPTAAYSSIHSEGSRDAL